MRKTTQVVSHTITRYEKVTLLNNEMIAGPNGGTTTINTNGTDVEEDTDTGYRYTSDFTTTISFDEFATTDSITLDGTVSSDSTYFSSAMELRHREDTLEFGFSIAASSTDLGGKYLFRYDSTESDEVEMDETFSLEIYDNDNQLIRRTALTEDDVGVIVNGMDYREIRVGNNYPTETIKSSGTNHYKFPPETSGTHEIGIIFAATDIYWGLWTDADGDDNQITFAYTTDGGATDAIDTVELTANTEYYLIVSKSDGSDSSYMLTILAP